MKSKNLFIGILIVFIGVVALLASLNVFDFHWSIFWRLWPIILIILGVAILPVNDYMKALFLVLTLGLGSLLYYHESKHYQGNAVTRFFNNHFSQWNWDWDDDDDDIDDDDDADDDTFDFDQRFAEPYKDVERASFDIDFGAGDLEILTPCAELASVHANSNFVKYSFRSEQGQDKTSLFLTGKGKAKGVNRNNDNDLCVALCQHPVWEVSIDMGAADADLDFSPYKVERLEINGGACDIELKLGDQGVDTQVEISTGVSDIDIRVPESVDCELHVESAITGKDFFGFEKVERGLWRTPNYGQGEHKIVINLSCAVSDISVERY